MRSFETFFVESHEQVTGSISIILHLCRYYVNGMECKVALMHNECGDSWKENTAWTANDAKGFIKILSNSGKIYQHVKNQA